MSFSDIALITRWIVPFWALGWLVLPLAARLFGALPDRGLSAGRVVALVLIGLGAFWGAALHFVPLGLSPLFLGGAPLVVALGWKNAAWRASIRQNWRAFLVSDAVFLLAFGAFLWVRLRHPEAGDLEKPMDMALVSSAMRAQWLPFQNPWFVGQDFTNYYYFGPFLGAMWARALATPPHLAYNLIQPLFCAFFLSSLWSLSAALSKSLKIGWLAMLLVGVGGHLEPLRQWSQTGHAWPLDWWKTSRVIENTINEYPAFTLLIGDLHAHFIAFCLATTHFCLCYCLIQSECARQRSRLLCLGAIFLGVFALTNTWDTPLYGLLWLGCALWKRKTRAWTARNDAALLTAIFLVPLVALPYFWNFKPQIKGVKIDPWLPDLFSLGLLWGGWWMLGLGALTLLQGEEKPSDEAIFRRFLIAIGAVALVAPFVFYIRGVFGDGPLRHQDTIFKFGLQAWLLLGTGLACEAGVRLRAWQRTASALLRLTSFAAGLAFLGVLSLAPACVAWTRAVRDAPRDALGQPVLSLDAARFLPPDEIAGIEWLRQNAKPGESVVESVGSNEQGGPGGDYDANFARVAAFSGVPCALGWPGHVSGWGAEGDEIGRRFALVNAIYRGETPAESMRQLGATYLFIGSRDWNENLAKVIAASSSGLQRVWPESESVAPQIWRLK